MVRLDVNYRRKKKEKKKTIKNTNIQSLNNRLLNNQQITEESKSKSKICIETSENENMTTQNLLDSVEAIQAYVKKQERYQINNLTLHVKQL